MKIIDYKTDNYKLILMKYFNVINEDNISIINISNNEVDFIIESKFIRITTNILFKIIKQGSKIIHLRINETILNEIILNSVLLNNKGN